LKILLIDDELDCLDSLASAIEPAGHFCDKVTAPAAGIEAYKRNRYDAVITDQRMPGMSGLQVLQAIRDWDPVAYVLLNTGCGDGEMFATAIKNGAYAVFGKPIDIVDLLETLDKIAFERRTLKISMTK
jgi:DNA-binding NtrC family response regulator